MYAFNFASLSKFRFVFESGAFQTRETSPFMVATGELIKMFATLPSGTLIKFIKHHRFISSTILISLKQWPLLLTWFNFNPSMDK